MYCSECGTQLTQDAAFCHKCGASAPNFSQVASEIAKSSSTSHTADPSHLNTSQCFAISAAIAAVPAGFIAYAFESVWATLIVWLVIAGVFYDGLVKHYAAAKVTDTKHL